jgi:salicylate hydroxylase
MKRKLRVAIVGGGLGGLTACLAFARSGIEAHVFEQANGLKEIGAGVGLSANAVRVLRELGLENALRERGFEPEATVGRDWTTGRPLFQVRLKDANGGLFGAPHIKIHRADLLDILAAAIPASQIHLNSRCVAASSSDQGAILTFADGRQEEADLAVGCDGIRSFVRATIHGSEAPRFTGNMCWRALIPVERLPPGHVPPNMNIWTGPGGHIVSYHVRSGRLVNVVATQEAKGWVEESWMVAGHRDELTAAYSDLHRDLRILLDNVEQCFKWGLFDRDPLRVWSSRRITLLGDAAHPMLPSLGQGAAMAIEDAYILAQAICRHAGDIPGGLRAYEAARIPRATQVQLASRMQSRSFHQQTSASSNFNVDWIYRYDPTRQAIEQNATRPASTEADNSKTFAD